MPAGIYPKNEPQCKCNCCIKRRAQNAKWRERKRLNLTKATGAVSDEELDRRALERPISNTETGRSLQSVRGIGSTLSG